MSPQLAIALPPFDVPGFDLKLHWHRRFDNEPRNRWLREQLITMFRDHPSMTLRRPARGWPFVRQIVVILIERVSPI